MSDQIQLYRSRLRRWRWRYVHANGHILADSGQGYSRTIDALQSAKGVTGLREETPGYLVGLNHDGSPRTVRIVEVAR